MGAITTKLNTEWTEKTIDENMFTIRARIEDLKNVVDSFIADLNPIFPTGDTTFDDYVSPIKDEIVSFRDLLDTYAEFINWRQP